MIDPLFLAELNERLFVQFVGGRWMAPLGERHLRALPLEGARMGRLVCAGPGDIARARLGMEPTAVQGSGLGAAYAPLRRMLQDLRRVEGFDDPVDAPMPLALPGLGPLVLLSAAGTPVSDVAAVLFAGAARGVLWKPAPRAAASAHLLMRALGPLAGGNLALVQGDHQTGALAAGQGALVWASPAAVPPGLAPVLSLAARVPPRR